MCINRHSDIQEEFKMSDVFSKEEVAVYQKKLNERKNLINRGKNSHLSQQGLLSGSPERELQGTITNNIWLKLHNVTQELLSAGVITGLGQLTEKAQRSGLHL